MRLQSCNRRGGKPSQRNFYLYPAPSGNRTAEQSELEWRREITPIIQHPDKRQILRGDLLCSETPHVQRVARKVDLAIAEIDHVDLGVPTAASRRLPFQTQRIRWRIEMFQIDGQLLIDKFEGARRRRPAMTVKISVAGNAVIEEGVPVIVSVSVSRTSADQNSKREKDYSRQVLTGGPGRRLHSGGNNQAP